MSRESERHVRLRRRLKTSLKALPLLGAIARRGYRFFLGSSYRWEGDSTSYWEARYAAGDDSGDGSYGKLSEFKAHVLNDFVAELRVRTVLEFGCGDGNQVSLAAYPQYSGYDVSPTAISLCQERFRDDPTKTFAILDDYRGEQAELALSLDVLYHLVEERVFVEYLERLFSSSKRYVVIYSSDFDDGPGGSSHVLHRNYSRHVAEGFPEWELMRRVRNAHPQSLDPEGSLADFSFYRRRDGGEA